MAIRACFIDVDGTAVLSEHRNRAAIEEVALEGGFKIDDGHWRSGFAGAGDDVIWQKICDQYSDFINSYPTAEAFEEACIEGYIKRRQEVTVNQPVLDLVHYFNQRGIYKGITSNSLNRVVLDNLDVTNYPVPELDVIVGKNDVRNAGLKSKPAPDPYILTLQKLNAKLSVGVEPIKPSECLILEDSKTGARAGLRFGGITVQILDDDDALPKREQHTLSEQFNGGYQACILDSLHHVCWSIMNGQSSCIQQATSDIQCHPG